MMRGFIGAAFATIVAGCTYLSETDGVVLSEDEAPGSALACDASRYSSAIGLNVRDIQVRYEGGPVNVRWPWQTVETDIQPNRLNFIVSQDGIIQAVTCG